MLECASANETVTIEAPAKVNLTLRVLGTRPDGYHELESVVAAVTLGDRLTFRPAEDLTLTCDGGDVPSGEENLVLKAARLLGQSCHVRLGARVHLEKRIPPGRGFGGGSSDAAATLAGLNVLWNVGQSREALARLGARLGSDVPLFFGCAVSVMRGRGERIEPVPKAAPRWWLVLAWPDFGCPTPAVYASYDRLPAAGPGRPAATAILDHLGGAAREAAPFLVNDLEPAARRLRPEGPQVRAILESAGAPAVGMTGSGSAYFALTDTEVDARHLAEAVRARGAEAVIARVLDTGSTKQREGRP